MPAEPTEQAAHRRPAPQAERRGGWQVRPLQAHEAGLGPARGRVRRSRQCYGRGRRLHRESRTTALFAELVALSAGAERGALAWGQVERDLCQNEGVRGYPTIKYWKGGAESKYQVSTRPALLALIRSAPLPLLLRIPLLLLFSQILTVVCAM